MDINAQAYWEKRFQEDWEALDGPRQSRFFASLALEHLPPWLFAEIRHRGLTLADWGCGQGDGTDLIANAIGISQVTGIDFSQTAVDQARRRYPNVRFEAVNWLAGQHDAPERFDIVFSSNTLEHFHQPFEVLDEIARRASSAVVLAVPYRELQRHPEHFVSFLPENVPCLLRNGFQLVWAKVVDCASLAGTAWRGEQLFLVYANPGWLRALGLCLADLHIDARVSLTAAEKEALDDALRGARAEATLLREQVRERSDAAEALQRSLERLEAERTTVHAELDARQKELVRVSDWAQEVATHPIRYAVKRGLYVLARGTYRALPVSDVQKQSIKNLAWRARRLVARKLPGGRPNDPVQPFRLTGQRITPHVGERDVFVFAVIDWHFRIQRPQHLARSLARAGRRVFFISNAFVDAQQPGYQVERLDPSLELYQVKLHLRGAPAIYFGAPAPEEVEMLQRSMASLLADRGALGSMSLVQHAYWFPLVKTLPNTLRVYDCMDHHEGFGNVPVELVALEEEMLRTSDLVVVTSQWLEEFASGYNRNVAVVRNAVEYDFFCIRPQKVYRDPEGRKVIGYFGAIAEWFDVALVRRIAKAHPEYVVLLVGNDTVKAASQLRDLRNVVFTGEVPYAQLTFYVYGFDVCLLPFQVTKLTLATNPVKVYEYLAAGKPVVCVDLPEVSQFGELVYKAADPDEFVAHVGRAIARAPTEEEVGARQTFAAQQTWKHRSERLREAIAALPLPKVSVIVLTFNNLELTKQCLASLVQESDYPNLEIIVVDNASTDGSPEYLRSFASRDTRIRLILNERNLGFAAGNNIGLAAASGDYLAILNNDTVVTRGWVLTMLRHLQADPGIGLAGPITNNIGNAAKVATQYTELADMPSEAASITLARPGAHFLLRTAAFFCVMLPRSVYETCGPLSEEYGLGFFEDDDYCRRVERAGLRIVCVEDVFVHHHLSASFSKLPSAERRALFERNKAKYEAKWGRWEPHTYDREEAVDSLPASQ